MSSGNRDFIVFGQPRITDEEISAVADTLRSGWIGTGPKTKEFEAAFARYQGVDHAAAVSSCTAALGLALRAYGIGQGDEVITTAMTFAATVSAILQTGAKPVLVDTAPGSLLMDLDQVEARISPRTRAIIPVHFAGTAIDLDRLLELRARHSLRIIHDCAHAIETEWRGKKLGSFADAACYSFYSTKNITTIEGGMICSNDSVFVAKAAQLSNHGMSKDAWKRFSSQGYAHYDVVDAGFKLNMTDVQAALGLCQLRTVDEKLARRETIWKSYEQALQGLPLEFPASPVTECRHARHLFTLLVGKGSPYSRDELLVALHQRRIGCGVHYRAIPELSYFKRALKLKTSAFPNAMDIGNRTFSLPLTSYLTDDQIAYVIDSVRGIFRTEIKRAA